MPFIGDPFDLRFAPQIRPNIGIILRLSAAQQTAQDKLF
jgi:tRNA(Leu) C34 or U34 (ribose-2'-O)-methylase TrmL